MIRLFIDGGPQLLPEEDIERLVATRSALLDLIAHHESGHAVIRPTHGEQTNDPNADLAAFKRNLAEVEGYLSQAGISFGG